MILINFRNCKCCLSFSACLILVILISQMQQVIENNNRKIICWTIWSRGLKKYKSASKVLFQVPIMIVFSSLMVSSHRIDQSDWNLPPPYFSYRHQGQTSIARSHLRMTLHNLNFAFSDFVIVAPLWLKL